MFGEAVLVSRESAAGLARQFVRDALNQQVVGPVLDDALLIVSELATNAILYDGPTFTVSVCLDDYGLRIAVNDHNKARAVPAFSGAIPDDAESGRGLAIVADLSTSWGVSPTADGKQVWARIAAHSHQ